MSRFQARPVIVEAFQSTGLPFPPDFQRAIMRRRQDGGFDVTTGLGPQHLKLHDWIYRDWNGSFWVMPGAMFETMFEAWSAPHEAEVGTVEWVTADEPRVKRAYVRREKVDAQE